MRRDRRRAALFTVLAATGALEGWEVNRQRRRGVDPGQDQHPRSFWLLALTGWPAGLLAIASARSPANRQRDVPLWSGLVVTATGVLLRQWSISTLGRHFVGYVAIQPDHQLVTSGPYRWLRHPSYTGLWLEHGGIGLAAGNPVSFAAAAVVPLIGIVSRIQAEEKALSAAFPDEYPSYTQRTKRLLPVIW